MNKVIKRKFSIFLLVAIFLAVSAFPAFAAKKADTGYAYLYFHTIDGDDISKLEKKIKVGRTYTFKNPNDYKYIVYRNDGEVIRGENDDLYDTVTGIEWWDETDPDNIHVYHDGDEFEADEAGAYHFRVHTDNPAVTGENIPLVTEGDLVYLSFYDENMIPIESGEDDYLYDTTITTKDEFTFPDPKNVTSNGIYWACTHDNGSTTKSYLFKAGEKVKFSAGEYEFHIATDDPVEISYFYPFGDIAKEGVEPGDQYGQTFTAKVGESVTLYKSPGAVMWGCTFKGWTNDNSDEKKVYSGGASFKVMDNQTVHLTMVYEEDENWDINAKDENGDITKKQNLMNTSENVNKQGGTGYDTYVDANGKLASKYTPKRTNSNSVLNGVPSTYKSDKELTSLKNDGNENDASSYTKDKYGYDMDESKITDPDMGDVLKQDNSAYQMDVYGNSMMYHSDLSRIDDMCVAWIRLYEMKNSIPSFTAMIQDWDTEEINRYEAIEFALLSQEYPGKENSIYKRWNSTTDAEVIAAKAKGTEFAPIQDAKLPEWKDEYLSESAFNALKYTKTLFSGWADTYDDGVYEAYNGTNSDINVVGAIKSISKLNVNSLVSSIRNITKNINFSNIANDFLDKFRITAYAEENELSTAKQYGSHITHSLDNETQTFRRQFFNKSKISRYSSYTIGNLDGLKATEMETLQIVYNFLVTNGFSEAMAAGACGNLWQECNFEYTDGLTGDDKKYVGLVQWGDDRKTGLKKYATSQGGSAANLDIQLGYILLELNSGYLKRMNAFISSHASGQTAATIDNVQLATDAWTIFMEGCVCHTDSGLHETHDTSKCAFAANGKSYQELGVRRAYAEAVMNAQQAGGANTELVQFAKSFLGVRYRWGGDDPAGFDCSGFVKYVLNHYGANISGSSSELATSAGTEVAIDDPSILHAGDLIFYAKKNGKINHVVIYIGDGLIIGANGSPTEKDAKGNYVLKAYGKGEVNIQKYNYRTPVKARRCLSTLSTAYQTVRTESMESTE